MGDVADMDQQGPVFWNAMCRAKALAGIQEASSAMAAELAC